MSRKAVVVALDALELDAVLNGPVPTETSAGPGPLSWSLSAVPKFGELVELELTIGLRLLAAVSWGVEVLWDGEAVGPIVVPGQRGGPLPPALVI